MSKEEILEYVYANCELPQEALKYLTDIEFVIKMLEKESSIMMDLPIEIQKKVLLIDTKYIGDVFDVGELLKDKKFAKELIDKDNDVLLELRGISISDDYIKNLTISYIRGERIAKKGSRLEKAKQKNIYLSAIKEVREDHELAEYLIKQNINYLPYIEDSSIKNNPQYIIQYVKANPNSFLKYYKRNPNILTAEVLETVLKYDFQNYKLIDKENPLMEQFYKSIERIKEIRPELKMDNPNLRYELLMDPAFINMDINIINSLLEYNTGNVDKIIKIKEDGKLDYLMKYIEQYNRLYGNNLENIQNAIASFESIQELLINTNNFEGILIDESKIKTIISTGNKFDINTLDDLQEYDKKVKEYFFKKINQSTNLEEIKQIYAEMLFNTSSEELKKFDEEYCNCNINELQEYANKQYIDSPISEEFKRRYEIYNGIKNIQNIDELKKFFDSMPLTICDIEETKKKISKMYSEGYNNEMLNLDDSTLEHSEYEGVDVIRLNGQSFNICIHRIFNFDFNMNSIANEIINSPEQWNLIEGSNTISCVLSTDKKIAALFRPLQKSNATPLILLDTEEKEQEYNRKIREKSKKIYDGEVLEEIDDDAVFYGFTQIPTNGIIKMDSSDMMVEHGKGHLEVNSSHSRMRSSEDLAYWTAPDYWNEIVQKRKETDIDKSKELREQKGTDRMLPSCIVCFDGHINEKSLLAARIHKIPILMIDRQQYLYLNKQKLEMARQEFSRKLTPEAMKEIFYRQPYYDVVREMPNMISIIKNNQEVSLENKKIALEYLAYLGQHFIEQSSGYIIDVPVEEYNKKMQEYINDIDIELQGNDTLVTMEDMKNAYKEISASDRKKRYEQLKKDIRKVQSKESERINE